MAQRGDYPRYYSECSYFVGNTCVSGVSVCWSAPCSWESEGPRTSDPTRPHALHTPGGWKGTGDGMRLWWHFFSISGFINFLRLNIHFFFFFNLRTKTRAAYLILRAGATGQKSICAASDEACCTSQREGAAVRRAILDIPMRPLHPVCPVVPFVFRVTCIFITSHEPATRVFPAMGGPWSSSFFVQTSRAQWPTAPAVELLARVRLQGLLPHGSLLWDSLLASLYLFPHPENGIYNGDCGGKKKTTFSWVELSV